MKRKQPTLEELRHEYEDSGLFVRGSVSVGQMVGGGTVHVEAKFIESIRKVIIAEGGLR